MPARREPAGPTGSGSRSHTLARGGLARETADDDVEKDETAASSTTGDGSPWNVGNKAVLVQPFDPNLRPSEVVFDKLAIWIRIYDLPFGLMNKQWGFELGNKVGPVMKVDVDEQGRAWGPFLRVKVQFDISKPLLRCITIFLRKGRYQRCIMLDMRNFPITVILVG